MQQKFTLPNNMKFSKGDTPHTKVLTLEPCFPGYGTTLGNALRRVLMSSLSGGAVVAVKIKDAKHEFDTIQYVQEDVLEIILNLKNLRFNVHTQSDEPIKLVVSATGEKTVTGKDVQGNSDVEVANPEQVICNLTDKTVEFEMELFVQKGMGYYPTESRHQEKLELGTIAIDAIFSPVLNCSFEVENVRVGELTNYDKLIMKIHTDGTMTPEAAVKEAGQILIDHFMILTGERQPEPDVNEVTENPNSTERVEEKNTTKEDIDVQIKDEPQAEEEKKNEDSKEDE